MVAQANKNNKPKYNEWKRKNNVILYTYKLLNSQYQLQVLNQLA